MFRGVSSSTKKQIPKPEDKLKNYGAGKSEKKDLVEQVFKAIIHDSILIEVSQTNAGGKYKSNYLKRGPSMDAVKFRGQRVTIQVKAKDTSSSSKNSDTSGGGSKKTSKEKEKENNKKKKKQQKKKMSSSDSDSEVS